MGDPRHHLFFERSKSDAAPSARKLNDGVPWMARIALAMNARSLRAELACICLLSKWEAKKKLKYDTAVAVDVISDAANEFHSR